MNNTGDWLWLCGIEEVLVFRSNYTSVIHAVDGVITIDAGSDMAKVLINHPLCKRSLEPHEDKNIPHEHE